MKVHEFIEWLKTQEQEATVYVMVQNEPSEYQSYGNCSEIEFTPEHCEYRNFQNNPFAKGQPYENAKELILGQGK